MKLITTLKFALPALCLMGAANAQETPKPDEDVSYEFRFSLRSAESNEDQTTRLEREVKVYCEGMTANLHCEDEITDAVNRELRADRNQRER